MWARSGEYGSSMKWHIADPNTVEEYEYINYRLKTVSRKKVTILCGKNSKPWELGQAKIKDVINIYQNNVCSYCRNKILEDEGIESRLLK